MVEQDYTMEILHLLVLLLAGMLVVEEDVVKHRFQLYHLVVMVEVAKDGQLISVHHHQE
jgi:hypothetical protein